MRQTQSNVIIQSYVCNKHKHKDTKLKVNPIQLSMFQIDDPQMQEIRILLQTLDLNTISPIEALLKLNEIKKLLE